MRKTVLVELAAVAGLAIGLISCGGRETSHLQISETASKLEIRELDTSGRQVAMLILTRGTFTMLENGLQVTGRQLSVQVNGQTIEHESAGFSVLRLPLHRDRAQINRFLTQPEVTSTLERWGITFAKVDEKAPSVATAPKEQGYSGCGYGWPVGIYSCCEWTNGYSEAEEYGCGYNGIFYDRACVPGGSGQTTATCGGPTGGNGCKGCWNEVANQGCTTIDHGSWCDGEVCSCSGVCCGSYNACGYYCIDEGQGCGIC
jgi:hypothetical protein